jgi:indolepyruvate ferredoxin oxidoreductase beta subunit
MEAKRILFTGVGGQGTLLASRLLGEAVMAEGMDVRVSEVHGMAQRGGVVESTVILDGLQSPIISDGEADVLVSFEPLECMRAASKCSASSLVITSISPVEPFTVKLGAASYPDIDAWLEKAEKSFARLYAVDAESMAREAGTVKAVNIVLLGILVGTGVVPVTADRIRQTIQEKVKPAFVEANLKAFEAGFEKGRE